MGASSTDTKQGRRAKLKEACENWRRNRTLRKALPDLQSYVVKCEAKGADVQATCTIQPESDIQNVARTLEVLFSNTLQLKYDNWNTLHTSTSGRIDKMSIGMETYTKIKIHS